MGAVLGIAAFGRTQEKLGGANNGGLQTPGTGFAGGASTFSQPQSGGFGNSSGFNSPAPNSFSSNSGFGAPTSGSYNSGPSWGTTPVSTPAFSAPQSNATPTGQVVAGFGGKPAPIQPPQPEI
jgi:hypothetical protein